MCYAFWGLHVEDIVWGCRYIWVIDIIIFGIGDYVKCMYDILGIVSSVQLKD